MSLVRFLSGTAILSLLLLTSAFGQTSSTVTGVITDKTGAGVPAAEVTAKSTDTGVERRVTTNESGTYSIPFLAPGDYTITVTKTGFRSVDRSGVRLEVNQTADIDVQLEVGQMTEKVTVTESLPILETSNSSLGQVIENKSIENLPLNGRNFVSLAILGPGVTGVGFGATGTIMSGTRPDDLRPASDLFANGNREGSNNFTYDSTDNNDRLTLSVVLRPSVEGVSQFKIQTNLMSSDQGRNSGATVNVISKSGSNAWHGSAYEFLRNDYFDAKNFFTPAGTKIPLLRMNQFGGTVGGPIFKNKLFGFGNYEGFDRKNQVTNVATVPTAAMRNGDFSAVRDIFNPFTTRPDPSRPSGYARDLFPDRKIPVSLFDSVMSRTIQAYPMPTSSGLVNNLVVAPLTEQGWDQFDGRLDYNMNEKNIFFGRVSGQFTDTIRPSTFPDRTIPGLAIPVGLGNEDTFAGVSSLKAWNAAAGWTLTVTPSLVMDARFGYSRFDLKFLQEGSVTGAQLGERLGVRNSNQGPFSDGIPIFSPSGYTGIGQTRSLPIIRVQNTYNPMLDFMWLKGKHTFKFGAMDRVRHVTQFQTNRGNGRFNFSRTFTDSPDALGAAGDAMAATLLGVASTIEQDFTLAYPNFYLQEYGFYIADDWKVNAKLTLNLGLRYELDTIVTEKWNRMSNFDLATGKLLIAGYNTNPQTGLNADTNNWAPRFGFAYQLDNKTVIRGGIGMFYNPAGSEGAYLRRHRQIPFGPINALNIDQFSATPRRVQDGLPSIPNLDFAVVSRAPSGGMIAIANDVLNGYMLQYNLQIQREVGWDSVIKLGYVASVGHKLDSTYNPNQPLPGPGGTAARRPLYTINPLVTDVTYNVFDGNSNFNSLQATAEKRFANSLGFLVAYTWAKSIDNVPNAFGGADNGPIPQDPRYRNVDRAVSGYNIASRFTASVVYNLPWGKGQKYGADFNGWQQAFLGGWQMNGIFTAQSGLPFTPVLATSRSNAGSSRPDLLGDPRLDETDPARYYNTSFNTANAVWGNPALYTYGNGGRNILRGPGRVNLDYSLFKDFSPSERWHLTFRAEVFNIFNTPQFGLPNTSIGTPNAGIITSIVGTPRQIQLGLRFSF